MRKPKRPRDPNQLAKMIVGIATGEVQEPRGLNGHKHEGQVKGGLKGGKARAEKLTKQERVSIARKAAKKRWSNK